MLSRRGFWLATIAVGVGVWAGLAFFADDVGEGAAMVSVSQGQDSFNGDLTLLYDHDSTVEVTASVANRGLFPVTVTGAWMFPATPFDSDDVPRLLLKQERVLIEGSSTSLPTDRDVSEPVDLEVGTVTIGGGEELDISIAARFGDCLHYAPGTGNTFEVLRIDYRHLGMPQRAEVPVRHVFVEAPESCPAD